MSTKKNPAKPTAAKQPPHPKPVSPDDETPIETATTIDQASGAAAFAQVRPQLAALAADSVSQPRLNVRQAATLALGLAEYIHQRGLRPRFALLHGIKEFDLQLLDLLPLLARATWYIRHRLDLESALSSTATLPAALVETCFAQRTRMLRVLDFYFEDDPQVRPTLDYIRKGAGYQDLADDLIQLSQLYATHAAALHGTPRHYDPADQQTAAQQASSILSHLGLGAPLTKSGERASEEDWADLQRRAVTLLTTTFDEIAATGAYLCRNDSSAQARFASLNSQVRSASFARSNKTKPAQPESEPDPTPDAG